jgi:hypothetical protein
MSYEFPIREYRGIQAGEIVNVSVSMLGELDLGLTPDEILTGTPTIAVGTGGPAVVAGTPAVNAAALRIDGVTVPIAKAVTFRLNAGGVAVGDYSLTITVGTNKSQTRKLVVGLSVE